MIATCQLRVERQSCFEALQGSDGIKLGRGRRGTRRGECRVAQDGRWHRRERALAAVALLDLVSLAENFFGGRLSRLRWEGSE